jgi:TorA maturation chaperone TorD
MDAKKTRENAAVAGHRSHVYGFLAAVYRQEVNSEMLRRIKAPRFLRVLSDLGVQWGEDLFGKPEQDLLEELAFEYARLFLGPGKHVSPHESVHRRETGEQGGRLWGDSTVEVKRFIETAGFHYDEQYKGLPDHISVELEFMEAVIARERKAWADTDRDKALFCRGIEKKFVQEHMSRWIPAFCDKVSGAGELPFYRAIALLTKRFMDFEMETVAGFQTSSPEETGRSANFRN